MITKFRADSKTEPNGQLLVIKAFECIAEHSVFKEYMILGYSLRGIPDTETVKHVADATHEFLLCSVAPDTPIDWDKSLFEQTGVSPLYPANVSFQMSLPADAAFCIQLDACVDAIRSNALSPDPADKHTWDHFLPTSFPMHHAPETARLTAQRQLA